MNDMEIRNFIKQTCCPFLAARKGYWIGGDSTKEKYMKGKNFYGDNAYNYLKKHEYSIKSGEFLGGENYDKKYRHKIIDWASAAYDRKVKELEEALNR